MKHYKINRDVRCLQRILFFKMFHSGKVYKRMKCKVYSWNTKRLLKSLIPITNLSVEKDNILRYAAQSYLEHRFDLLGSGWVSVGYKSKVLGVEGYKYEKIYNSKEEYFFDLTKVVSPKNKEYINCMLRMVSKKYEPICWCSDFKTGYTWKPDYLDENYSVNCPKGTDIKTVWELGRMQWCPLLAIAGMAFSDLRETIIKEFEHVVLDFITANPVGIGVNWILPMEASIRAVNLLIAYDILNQLDEKKQLSKSFHQIFSASIYQHGKFIFDHLEYDLKTRKNGNHYYSNIIGLLYISSYLNETKEVKKWYLFAKEEYLNETKQQFFEDGGNTEASTSYHRLMAEMMIFGAAILNRRQGNLPKEVEERIIRAVYFTEVITKKNGNIIQIGDNDSGRFVNCKLYGDWENNFKAETKYINLSGYTNIYGKEGIYFDENILCHDSLIGYFNGLYHCSEIKRKEGIEKDLIHAISNQKIKNVTLSHSYQEKIIASIHKNNSWYKKTMKLVFKDIQKEETIRWGYFSDFGLYFYKTDHIDFYMYTGGTNGRIREGHSHNDILHCEFSYDGQDILYDKGSYYYTALEEKRKIFCGKNAHFVPDYGREPRELIGIFQWIGKEKAKVMQLNQGKILVKYTFGNQVHYREVEMNDEYLFIHDYGKNEFKANSNSWDIYSNGYGKLMRLDNKVNVKNLS